MSRVFIGIPTINRPKLVRETIDSVLAQSFVDIHVIVSDNRSESEAVHSVKRYVDTLEDARLEFVQQPRNDGEYGQGRYFYSESAGADYFMILHDDDVIDPSYIDKAVATLDASPDIDAFLADPYVFDEAGEISAVETKDFLVNHGRETAKTGRIDVLTKYMMRGFLPISGTLFRRTALERSGFVDGQALGNFPFECDVFLRLGHLGARAWYQKEQLIGFRFHRSSMRNYMKLMQNRDVERMLQLFSSYEFEGVLERRRRAIVSRLHRANSIIDLREGNSRHARANLGAALKSNALSIKAWAMAPFVMLVPGLCSLVLPKSPATLDAPVYVTTQGKGS